MCQCSTAVRWRGELRYRTSPHPSRSKTSLNRMWTMRWSKFSSDLIHKHSWNSWRILYVSLRYTFGNEKWKLTGNASSWYFSEDFVQICEQKYTLFTIRFFCTVLSGFHFLSRPLDQMYQNFFIALLRVLFLSYFGGLCYFVVYMYKYFKRGTWVFSSMGTVGTYCIMIL